MELLLHLVKWSMIIGMAALALTMLKPLLDKRYSAKWRWGAWLVMAVLLLAPLCGGNVEKTVTPAVVIEVPKVEVSVSREDGVSIQRPGTALSSAIQAPVKTEGARIKSKTFPMEELLLTLWVTGGALFLLYHALGTWYFTRRARRWSRAPGEDALRVYESVSVGMGVKRPPELRVSGAAASPMVLGLFRARLLLPEGDIPERELTFILRHELTHYRRHDLWYKLLLTLANAAHWFNPLIYLLRREAERDLELTCDDAVVAGTGAEERRAYSETLLSSIHRQKGLGRAVLSTHFYGGKGVMKERFRNILGKRGRKRGWFVLAAVLIATIAAACTFGLRTSADGPLSEEELAQWQEKVESREMDRYLHRMYTDVSYLVPEEALDEAYPAPEGVDKLGHEDINPKVLSGTRSGDTVTLEIEGKFASRLPSGTMTLVNGEPVSFTNPLYTAVETASRELMEATAASIASYTDAPLEFTEKYITNLFCEESMEFDGKTYYVWNLYYIMKPDDIENVMFAGGMDDANGWVTQNSSMGHPILIASTDDGGGVTMEELTWSGSIGEDGFTWEEYVYCHLHIGMDEMYPILNGWPEANTEFILSLRSGHETWALDWQDVALSYLDKTYGVTPDNGIEIPVLRTFQADLDVYGHDYAMLVQGVCGGRIVTLLLTSLWDEYGSEYSSARTSYWQVNGVKWDPDAPQTIKEQNAHPVDDLTADELATAANYFNDAQHNGLLRFPYTSLGAGRDYIELLFYDLGEPVTDETELNALAEAYFDGEWPGIDCTKLTREFIRGYLEQNFTSPGGVDGINADIWLIFDMLEKSETLPYLEDYDAWYMVHGDTMMDSYTFDHGEWAEDGTLRLYYTTDLWQYNDSGELDLLWDQPMCAAMVPNPDESGGWLMLSNLLVE